MRRAVNTLFLAVILLLAMVHCSGRRKHSAPQQPPVQVRDTRSNDQYADVHFHISNYVAQGASLKNLIDRYMGRRVARSTIMPIPLEQVWDYFRHFAHDRMPPTYYIGPATPLEYYSFVDAMVAREFTALSPVDKARLDPMITGFNPMNMYAVRHIKRVLMTFPGVFDGIGEFTVHKEVVSDKMPGEPIASVAASATPPDALDGSKVTLYNPSLASILNFAAEAGLVVVLHNDIYKANVKSDGTVIQLSPNDTYTAGLKALCMASPNTKVVWAHVGLCRFVVPASNHLDLVSDVLNTCPNWSVDISFDLVQRAMISPRPDQPSFNDWVQFVTKYQDRVLFGSDNVIFKKTTMDSQGTVTPGTRLTPTEYYAVQEGYRPLWDAVGPAVTKKVNLTNYVGLFDRARQRVRAWEAAHIHDDVWNLQ